MPLATYKSNLKELLTHPLIQAHNPRIIVVTPGPIDASRWAEHETAKGVSVMVRKAEVTAQYAIAAKEAAAELGPNVAVVDLWNAFMDEAIRNTPDYDPNGPMLGSHKGGKCQALLDLLVDGLHFTGAGYRLYYKELIAAITAKWPDQSPENMPWPFPPWQQAPKLE